MLHFQTSPESSHPQALGSSIGPVAPYLDPTSIAAGADADQAPQQLAASFNPIYSTAERQD